MPRQASPSGRSRPYNHKAQGRGSHGRGRGGARGLTSILAAALGSRGPSTGRGRPRGRGSSRGRHHQLVAASSDTHRVGKRRRGDSDDDSELEDDDDVEEPHKHDGTSGSHKRTRMAAMDDESLSDDDSDDDDVEDDLAVPSAAAPRKPAAEADPDAAMIAALERKLGVRKGAGSGDGAAQRKLSKLDREFAADGFDNDFGTFLETLGASSDDDEGEDEEDGDVDDLEDDADATFDDADADDAENDDVAHELTGGTHETSSASVAEATARRKAKFASLYGRTDAEQAVLVTPEEHALLREVERLRASGAYILPRLRAQADAISAKLEVPAAPPSRRATAAAVDITAPHLQALKRRCHGLLNRISEANIEPIATEIAGLYRLHAAAECNAMLFSLMVDACAVQSQVMKPLVMVFGALIAALHVMVGPAVGAYFIEHITLCMAVESHLEAASDAAASLPRRRGGKLANHMLLLLVYLYVFHVVFGTLVVDVLRLLGERFQEHDAELLLLALSHAGFIIRNDDPAGLRDILKGVHKHVTAHVVAVPPAPSLPSGDVPQDARAIAARIASSASTAASTSIADVLSSDADASVRVKVLADLMMDLKNNRKRSEHEQVMQRGLQLRKWLGKLASRTAGVEGAERRMRITWADLCAIPSRGRWWLVGSSWVGHQADVTAAAVVPSASGSTPGQAAGVSARDAELHALAVKMRMTTSVRRSVFVALMGSDDVESAMDRLMRLGLKGPVEREIVRVMLDCAGQEGTYNPFYALVAVRLCTFHNRFRFTFQLAFWDAFKTFAEATTTSRRVYNLARVMAHMIQARALTLAVVKVFDFTSTGGKETLFLKALLSSVLLDTKRVDALTDTFSRLGAGKERMMLRDGIAVFMRRFVSPESVASALEGRTASGAADARLQSMTSSDIRTRINTAHKALDRVKPSDDDDDMMPDPDGLR